MAAENPRDSARKQDSVRETATRRNLAEHETIPPSRQVSSILHPESTGDRMDLPSTLGRYQIQKSLGRGAMGAVFLAHDTELDRSVALKVPLGDTSEGSEWLERFRREARAAGALRHANICPVYDVARIDGFHVIAMAFVDGQPLSDTVASGKAIPIRRAVQIVRKVASALADAHAQNIIHRDLKPANIMIDQKGEPIVMDFGLARQVATAGSEQLTQEGAVAGSPAYMSPEQFEGRPEAIGTGTDIYSLGVILYELLTGEIPYRGSMMEIMGQILKQSAQPPSTIRDGIDEKLDRICLKMMAKKEADRFGSMKTVVKVLTEYLKSDSESQSASVSSEASTEEDLDQINRACRKADRFVDEHKYEEAIAVLSALPNRLKTSRVRDLLLDATDLKRQFDGLLAAVEKDLASYEHPERLFRKARRLMQLRPDHRRAQEIFAEVSGAKSRSPLRIRRS
jgi:serine/threonine protein kinase